jgi:hypothetical protein
MIEISLLIKNISPEFLANTQLYLDPGSGSFLLQILIATIAGAGIFLATYWRKVKAFFDRLLKKNQESGENKKRRKDE